MPDREKVIKGLETCIWFGTGMVYECTGCPYDTEELVAKCVTKMQEDALELLKEQEPIAPVVVSHSRGIAYNCGACGTEIAVIKDTVSAGWAKENVRYCQRCGSAVKW